MNLWDSAYAARRDDVATLIGPSAARLAVKVYVQYQASATAVIMGLVAGIWLERKGPVLLWLPMSLAIAIFCGLFVPVAVGVKRMNRAASEFVSAEVGYSLSVTPNQFVLRRASWESAIGRAKQLHERALAGRRGAGTCEARWPSMAFWAQEFFRC